MPASMNRRSAPWAANARHGQASEQIAERELQKGEVAPRGDRRHRDDREGRGLGRDDRKQDGPSRKVAGAEEVISCGLLVSRYPEPDAERQGEVHDDDAEIEGVQGSAWVRDKSVRSEK